MSVENLLKAMWFTPGGKGVWGLPVLFEGPPGGGKTSVTLAAAKRFGLVGEWLAPSLRGEGSFGTTPVPREVDGQWVLTYPGGDWTRRFYDAKSGAPVPGVVVVDEVKTVEPGLQKYLLGLIDMRTVGSTFLGKHVRTMGLTNSAEDSPNGQDLAASVANRFGHMPWPEKTFEEFAEWMMGGAKNYDEVQPELDAVREEQRVMAEWPTAFAKASGVALAFLNANRSQRYKKPDPGAPDASGAWPSDRTWEFAVRALAGSYIHQLADSDRDAFVGAFIGQGAMKEFVVFQRNLDLPAPDAVLDGKVHFEHRMERLDISYAVLASCVNIVLPKDAPKRKERVTALWKLLEKVAEKSVDICIAPTTTLLNNQLASVDAVKLLARTQPILGAAGNPIAKI